MTYVEFKQNFLPEFLNIKSFKGKIEYANQNLQRIGSGTGRIVYDIDGQKVLKLARNPKGIAQNAEESGLGRDYYFKDMVTEVFEAADDDSWLVAEKAKKVNENRIKQLTGIPSLSELFYYLRNFAEENKGKRRIFGIDDDIKEILDNNEFAQSLEDLIANYNLSAGDMSKPSSYGEVVRNGISSIVLTDYGLSDEVYATHYDPERKKKPQYQMYEYYNDANPNDDILSNMGDSDGKEIRNSMWVFSPYDVNDGSGVVNDGFISFVLNRDKYPTRALPSAPYLIDEFQNCLNNLRENINHAGNKRKFYNNLLELQDYLIRGKFYDREPLPKEMVIDESEQLKEYVERSLADSIASQVAQQFNYGTPKYLGEGGFGVAYDIDNKMVLKVTSDRSEANENMELMGKPLKYIAQPYRVFAIKPESGETKYYVIILEKLKTDPAYFKTMVDRMNFAFGRIMSSNYADVIDYYVNRDKAGVLDDNVDEEKIQKYLSRNPKDKEFFNKILAIGEEVNKYGLKSVDYINPNNLGYKPDGTLGFFDVGFGDYFFKSANQPEEITVSEDSTSKFSTADGVGRDEFPAHNNNDESPVTDNNIPTSVDTSIDEDLEYNHASDATKDKYIMTERVKSYMPGSKSVTVKKRCRLGGLGGTSAACNQGDIRNISLKSIDETVEVTLPTNLPGYESFPILNDGQPVGELNIIDRGVWGGNHYIAVDKIFIDKEFRGMGFANEAMEDLFEYADKNNIIITLTPDSLWGSNKNKLKNWYKSIGFVENKGKKKDFQTMQAMYRLPKSLMNEDIDASEAHSNEGSIKTILDRKRDVGFVEINKGIAQTLEKYNIGVIPARMVSAYVMMAIIYHQDAKDKAFKLYDIIKRNNGYLNDKTPEEAREIGRLLDYKEASIEEYIRRNYSNVSIASEPEDYDNLTENFPAYEKQIEKDVTTHQLDKKLIRVYNDGIDKVSVYIVNGDEVRDSGFIEWVDGGNHWVDADLPKDEQKYASHIAADDIWVDDVFTQKPIDFEGILLHERTESYIIKHYGYQYDDAHEIANKIELLFRKKAVKENITSDEDAEKLASLMYTGFKKKFNGNKKHNKFIGEGVGDVAAEKQFGIEPLHRGFEDKFVRDQQEDVVYRDPDSNLVIIRNPKRLDSIFGYARGVIDTEGNLYIEQRPVGIHYDILYALNSIGLVEDEADWDTKLPNNFVTIQRYLRSNKILLGESNFSMVPDNERPADSQVWQKIPSYEEAEPIYQRFLDKAKQKTPIFEFINMPLQRYAKSIENNNIFAPEIDNINEAHNTIGKYYRAVSEFMGDEVEFEPNGYYEAIGNDGYPVMKYDTFWMSDKPEIAASKSVGGAVMGIYSMMKYHGSVETYIFLYEINKKPDVDISHWTYGDFEFLQEVRYRKPVKGKYVGKVLITDDMKKRFDAFYNLQGLDAYDEPDEESLEIAQDTNYNEYLAGVDNMIHESMINEAEIMSIQNLPFKNEIESLGGEIYAVGGAVRDEFLGKESKDLDIIIRGIPEEQLVKILAKYGTVNPVGKSFAVMKFRAKNSNEIIDIALPRTEISTGEGHKDFEITADYRLPIEKDLERRDFTINAIAKDMDGNIIDPFDGQEDLSGKVIRVTHSKSFSDDPLRMLRAVRFASILGFKIEPETYQMIKNNAGRIKSVAKDRVQEELLKIIEKGDPFTGAQLLQDSGLLQQMTGINVPPFTNDENWKNVRTLAEFVYMLVRNVQSPVDFYKRNLRGDVKIINELQGLMIGMDEKNISNDPAINRSIAHDIVEISKGTKVLQSKLLPPNLQIACQELLTGKYPMTVNNLAVNGNDLIALGLKGNPVGEMQELLLSKVYADEVKNDKKDLLNIASQGNNMLKEDVTDKIEYGALLLFLDIPNWNKITSIIDKNNVYNEPGYGIETEPHVTILYGFHKEVTAEEVFDLYKLNIPLKPIEIHIKGINIFENPKFDVVKFDVESDMLTKAHDIMKDLPNTEDFPEYHPHITIAYVKHGEGQKYIKQFQKERILRGSKLVFSTEKNAREELTLSEGVADTYAEKQFNIPNIPAKANVQAMAGVQKEIESPVAYVIPYMSQKRVPIFLNPKSLTNFDYDARAIVNDKGDLYVAQEGGRFNHGAMAKAIGLFDNDNDFYEHDDEYQGLHRIGNSNGFGLSDTGWEYARLDYENLENIKYILGEAKKKNPQYEFYAQYYIRVNTNDEADSLNEFSFPEFPEPNDTWNINGEQVGIPFFVEKYDIWNQGGYADPSEASVLEFLENNYEDFSHDERLKKLLLRALTDRNVLDEERKFTKGTTT